jgi:uncharacterized protein (DUF305 family)
VDSSARGRAPRRAGFSPTAGVWAILVLLLTVGCGGPLATGAPHPVSGSDGLPPLLGAGAASLERPPHAPGDVHFMTGMIPHHAQAVRMAALVPERSTRREILVLAERMAVAQDDEIGLMRQWLADVGEEVPPPDATHMRMEHGGMVHDMLMPGMLTEEEFAELTAARGDAFDRLFLTLMIRHHEGAIVMIDELFASPGAGQDDFIFKFASDMYADQTTEIHFMRLMLTDLP